MPNPKPVLAAVVALGLAILVIFPDYIDLQSSSLVEDFLGVLGDEKIRASAAAAADMAFAISYGLLGVVLYSYVSTGAARLIGTLAIIGAAAADEVENIMVLVNAQRGAETTQGAIDLMTTAGGIKWGLLLTAIILFLALAGHRWLEDRRS